jgi:REP element-mobilizing transposase RayT
MSYNQLRKGRFSESQREYFITTVVHERKPLFQDFLLARRLINELARIERNSSTRFLAWVVMPDHFHALLQLGEQQSLASIVGLIKGRSARALNAVSGRSGRFWQPGFYDHALRQEEERLQLARYIVANPLRARLVQRLGDYPHWDSVWL